MKGRPEPNGQPLRPIQVSFRNPNIPDVNLGLHLVQAV